MIPPYRQDVLSVAFLYGDTLSQCYPNFLLYGLEGTAVIDLLCGKSFPSFAPGKSFPSFAPRGAQGSGGLHQALEEAAIVVL